MTIEGGDDHILRSSKKEKRQNKNKPYKFEQLSDEEGPEDYGNEINLN